MRSISLKNVTFISLFLKIRTHNEIIKIRKIPKNHKNLMIAIRFLFHNKFLSMSVLIAHVTTEIDCKSRDMLKDKILKGSSVLSLFPCEISDASLEINRGQCSK